MSKAFTLIELLVVIAIITLLTGLLLAGVGVLRDRAKSSRTTTILATVQQGLGVWAADRGGLPSPAEHPLAGSKATRAIWMRSDSSWISGTGEAYMGVDVTNLDPGPRARLLNADDRFADSATPALFGLRRNEIGVLGVPQADVSRVKLLPAKASAGFVFTNPDDPAIGRMIQASGTPIEQEPFLRQVLGGGAFDELTRLGALWSPQDDDPAKRCASGLVFSLTSSGLNLPGTATTLDGSITHRYRLRGLGIYDVWGNEVLYTLSAGGRNVRLTSAGKDGFFRWRPGPNGVFDTTPTSNTPAGDDTDGAKDNVTVGK